MPRSSNVTRGPRTSPAKLRFSSAASLRSTWRTMIRARASSSTRTYLLRPDPKAGRNGCIQRPSNVDKCRRRRNAHRQVLPVQLHTDLRDARCHDVERSKERRSRCPDRRFLRIGVQQVEGVDEPRDATASGETEALLDTHVEECDVVHASGVHRLGENPNVAVIQPGHERAAEGVPGLVSDIWRNPQVPRALVRAVDLGRPGPELVPPVSPCIDQIVRRQSDRCSGGRTGQSTRSPDRSSRYVRIRRPATSAC